MGLPRALFQVHSAWKKNNAQQIGCLLCVFFMHGELFYPTVY
jgi:hypothetical protein